MLDISTSTPVQVTPRGRPVFSCLRTDTGAEARIAVAGELDLATAPQLEAALRQAEACRPTVLDLRGLTFVDCSGARVMEAAHRRALQAGGRLVVVRGPADVERLFVLAGVEPELEFVDRSPAAFSPVIE